MRRIPTTALLCAFVSTLSYAAPPAGSFTLTFQDNFDGTKLDGSKWKVGQHVMGIEGVGGNNPENITVSGGTLKIRASTDNVDFGNTTFNNSGGEISTFMNFNQKYGYFEARIRYPSVQGLWPAFWLMPDRGTSHYGNLNVYNRSYLKFNLASSGIGSVSSATLRLKVAAMTSVSAGQSNSVSVFAVDDDSWKETGSGAITWNNAPTWDPRYLDQEFNQQGELSVGDFVEFDVRDFVAAEISGDKIISLAVADTFMKDKLIEFHSSEASNSANRPRLIVNGGHYIATEDAYVNWGNANTNYGNATTLRVRDDFGSGVASTFDGGMEIDIMEKLGVWGSNRTAHVLHWDGYDAQQQTVGFGEIAVNNSTNYHTYGLYWEDNFYVFYIDGVQTGAWWNDRVMSTPAYVLLSMQLGGANNTPTAAIQNQAMEVDYVRVYSGQKSGGINAHEGDRKAIINKYTEKALQTPGGAAGAADYADMVQNTYNATWDSQRWNVIDAGSGYYYVESVRSGKALMPEGSSTATDALIEQFTWSNYNAQKWTFFKTDAPGYYRLKNKHSSKVMRPLGGNTANDAKISQVPVNAGASSQRWQVTN